MSAKSTAKRKRSLRNDGCSGLGTRFFDRYYLSVFGTQIAVCFAIWLGFGYFAFRMVQKRALFRGASRAKRIALATAILIGSAAALLGSLIGLQSSGGIVEGSLTVPAWLGAVAIGSFFVGLQVVAIDLLLGIVSETVTTIASVSSEGKEGSLE